MNQRLRLIGRMIWLALGLIVLSACGTTSAATLLPPAEGGAANNLAQPVALAEAPHQSLQTQGVTQTIILTPPPPVIKQPGQIIATPTVYNPEQTFGGTPISRPTQPSLPVNPPAPVYPPQPVYPPISVPPVQGPITLNAPGVLGLHIVQPGDTLYCIGRAYQVDPIAIAQANSINGYAVIVPGHALLIPATKWTSIPEGPICRSQFAVDWNQSSATSITAAPLCGYVAFNYPAAQPSAERFSSTPAPVLISTGSFANGFGETFAMTVTGRRTEAIMAFTANTPVCIGASRPQPGEISLGAPAPATAAPAAPSQTPAPQLNATDVLSDPNTLNLIIEFDLTGAAAQRYGLGTPLSFAIDPSIAPNA
ncbi:MAG TPA: LysM domain-containing protein, partial [Anaerolineae bacterium]|nr:LysM domain-containing protein [Anaerolineae bacterium]